MPKLSLKATISSRSSAEAFLTAPGDAVIVDRDGLRWLFLSCPCGCGAAIPVNLDPRAGPAWRLYQGMGGISLYPSVVRRTDCRSHFIVHRGSILMLGTRYDSHDFYVDRNLASLEEETFTHLSWLHTKSTEEIADSIAGSIPWDILQCCRRLVRRGLAVEGRGRNRGRFKRA
ncbi:DUF6527 family protein [Ferribacterium limneticum]|uniref:DUF6527 family protein n=1 Tax=Ferribacterium limneticum TaxID=76259 RepID=UPI001CF87EE6